MELEAQAKQVSECILFMLHAPAIARHCTSLLPPANRSQMTVNLLVTPTDIDGFQYMYNVAQLFSISTMSMCATSTICVLCGTAVLHLHHD